MQPLNALQPPELDESCRAAYWHALREGCFDEEGIAALLDCDPAEVRRIRATLTELCLLASHGVGRRPELVDPGIAEAVLANRLEVDIIERRSQVVRVSRQMRELSGVWAERRKRSSAAGPPAVRLVEDAEAVRGELALAARECEEEVLSVQPGGGRSTAALSEASSRDALMLTRGVQMRVLYQHTARADLATRAYVGHITELGGEVRTTAEIHERVIIFDARVAFVPQNRTGRRAPGAAIVTDPTVVGYLWRTHHKSWLSAHPFDTTEESDDQGTSEELKQTILRLMATGLKDDVIARRLGVATRTCRRYMAAIMEELGATSRFMAGVKAVELGLVQSVPLLTEPGQDPGPEGR
ncbi:LuxR C-terminal-related transcriptional regulator [Streptomyces sp. WMMB303]|uniref:helix-turn-helix transcriptional regulator n=1 Tax=Streptomyces sp. WMMB303 TaxID=3034154 RepID=UPI0023EBDC3C|nr:LuxR C-terminal-related transcriptional regulator [Streptomyces sp. WMMB303]MDF4251748.1 LuxR C-terminal-related transcriptional regulator [Streptomyces sp. WMMB303]